MQPFVIHWCYFCCARNWQLHGCLYWMASNLQYLIMILVGIQNRLKTFYFTDLSTFFTWWLHVNTVCVMTRKCLFYYYIHYSSLPNFILKKTDFIGFFKIRPRHPDGLKKTDLGGKKQQREPCPGQTGKRGSCRRDIVCITIFSCMTRLKSQVSNWAWTGSGLDILQDTCDF